MTIVGEKGDKKVLIVDDEPANIELLVEVFDMLGGYSVSTTMNPFEAVEMYREENYSVVLLDITMPQMSGFEVLEKFSSIDKAVSPQVYVLTGHHDAETRQRVNDLGATGLLTKPFDISQIISLVDSQEAS